MIKSKKNKKTMFSHEKLNVYQKTGTFIAWTNEIFENVPKSNAVTRQFDRASTSILLNIAEGNGKYTSKDRCRFFDMARGSALECAACLDVFVKRQFLEPQQVAEGKQMLQEIVNMLIGLIRSNSEERVYEPSAQYAKSNQKNDKPS